MFVLGKAPLTVYWCNRHPNCIQGNCWWQLITLSHAQPKCWYSCGSGYRTWWYLHIAQLTDISIQESHDSQQCHALELLAAGDQKHKLRCSKHWLDVHPDDSLVSCIQSKDLLEWLNMLLPLRFSMSRSVSVPNVDFRIPALRYILRFSV